MEARLLTSGKVTFAEISPSEFFYRNRDLAGFSNPARALYMAVRELVENSLDACEQPSTLPDVHVRIVPLEPKSDGDPRHYVLRVQDNGPGIDPRFVPNAFGRVFFGSKFRLRQARGMFGMGGTMAVLYGQITTNRPVIVQTAWDGKTRYTFELMIDIQNNTPIILRKGSDPSRNETGTAVQVTLLGDYTRASPKIHDYLKQTAMVNPYANITFIEPTGRPTFYPRNTTTMPPPPQDTRPHPYGIDVEALRRLLHQSSDNTLLKFLVQSFHRVGERTARKFLEFAGLDSTAHPRRVGNGETVGIVEALHRFPDFLPPDASCLSPLGEDILRVGIEKELQPEFVATTTRPPAAYSGFPFIVEVGLAYGSKSLPPGLTLYRFANRIPLLYDEGSDVAWKVLNEEIDWRRYHIPEQAPLAVITHVCSTKVPYKTVGKEYLADRPEVERELKNALREVLRQLSAYLGRKGSLEAVRRKLNIYGKYLPLIARFATDLARAPRPPRYRRLLGEKPGNEQAPTAAPPPEREAPPLPREAQTSQVVSKSIEDQVGVSHDELIAYAQQKTIDEFS